MAPLSQVQPCGINAQIQGHRDLQQQQGGQCRSASSPSGLNNNTRNADSSTTTSPRINQRKNISNNAYARTKTSKDDSDRNARITTSTLESHNYPEGRQSSVSGRNTLGLEEFGAGEDGERKNTGASDIFDDEYDGEGTIPILIGLPGVRHHQDDGTLSKRRKPRTASNNKDYSQIRSGDSGYSGARGPGGSWDSASGFSGASAGTALPTSNSAASNTHKPYHNRIGGLVKANHSSANPTNSTARAPPRTSSLLPPPRNTSTPIDNRLDNHYNIHYDNTDNDKLIFESPIVSTSSSSSARPDPLSSPVASTFFFNSVATPTKATPPRTTRTATSTTTSPPVSKRHSRTSSIGAISEGFRNLNRWSSSTASSRASWDNNLSYHQYLQQQQRQQSPRHHRKLSSLSRRMSVDSVALASQLVVPSFSQSPPNFSSPRKLSKRQPSSGSSPSPKAGAGVGRVGVLSEKVGPGVANATANGNWSGKLARSGIPINRPPSSPPPLRPPFPPPSVPSAPPPNLPPIISLPPLSPNPEPGIRSAADPPRSLNRGASPAVTTPNSVFSSQVNGGSEPRDYFWTDVANPNTRTPPPLAPRVNPVLLPPATITRDNNKMPEKKGHTRSRSSTNKSSSDSTKARDRGNKPSQKAMLSKALSKANAAVQLDNAQEYNTARESYLEACDLLQQVLARTSGEEDRNKLEAIRRTYTTRIEELDGLLPPNSGVQIEKKLPARPNSVSLRGFQTNVGGGDGNVDPRIDRGGEPLLSQQPPLASHVNRPSESKTPIDFFRPGPPTNLQSSFSRSPMRRNFEGSALTIPGADDGIVPAPLSPRRPISPAATSASPPDHIMRQDFSIRSERERLANSRGMRTHRRNLSHESASWLDPIDESGGSTASSVRSRASSFRARRTHSRNVSGATEAEFDAALDAAVEAAYDDGYDAMESSERTYNDDGDDYGGVDVVAKAMRKVELAKERVRQTEREAAIDLARERERQRQMSISQNSQTSNGGGFFDPIDSDEEEEQMLAEMTRNSVMEDFSFGRKPTEQSIVPRESDSSGLTTRTWHSSIGSNPPTSSTTLSTVAEMHPSTVISKATLPPSLPPPPQALPGLPPNRPPPAVGVRSRRLSGQNPKQLKIETQKIRQAPNIPPPPVTAAGIPSRTPVNYIAQQRQALSATSTRPMPFSMRASASPVRAESPADGLGPPSPLRSQEIGQNSDELRTGSPSSIRVGAMRKNFSSSSLKSLKSRQISGSHVDDSDFSPNTPLSHQISNTSISRQPNIPALPTPLAAAFHEKYTGAGFGGLHLFDSDFHSPTPQLPSSLDQQHNPDTPVPLEPCPSDVSLRPFWLMRALYQTLAHPRGGYLSNKLFVPRDAWKVKGVKLRYLEDKTSQCDLLTAALLKLARVDSTDADAVLEEMQSFENILEMVQAVLTRRLGNEVGVQGMTGFKDEKEAESAPPVPRSASVSAKTGAFSWRRLRSKGSAVNLTNAYGGKSNSGGASGGNTNGNDKDTTILPTGGSIPSLPMTVNPSSRPAKRDLSLVKFDGPYANYMASLARLFDAAQVVDQIARQVDDPGLRHADKTQVGLELCTRHAAEFFGFYICRFTLTDLGMLLDKFVKRGSEWVLN